MRWEKVQVYTQQQVTLQPQELSLGVVSSGPGKRWGHTCNAVKGGRYLYVFGGYGKDNCQTNQVHVFDTATQTWSQPMIKGTPPTPRDSHTCTTVGDNLFVFGGTDGMNPLKDLYILDTSSHTWICPNVRGEGPEAREGHSAALVGKRLYIFGGCGKSSHNNEEIYYNDLYILNTETFVWKHAATSGNPPSARDSHTCSSWRNKIIVIGGEDGHDYYLSDIHILDTDTLTWKELNATGQMLPPRAGHSTVAIGKCLFVFGGFTDAQNLYDDLYMLDIDSGIWIRVLTAGEGPSARFSVAGDCLDPLKGGVVVFIGGCNKSLEALDDMFYLYTGLLMRDERKLEKLSLRKQLKLKCQEQFLTNPVHDKALVRVETGSDRVLPTRISSYGHPRASLYQAQGKTTFQAKVSESFPNGYTIETIIDGQPLRGILFSNKPNSIHTSHHNSSRKRAAGELGRTMLNGDKSSLLVSSRAVRQILGAQKQGDINESASLDTRASAPSINDPATANASLHKDSTSEAPVALPNLNDDKSGDVPIQDGEAPTEIGPATADNPVTNPVKEDEKRPNPEEPMNQ